MGKCFDEFRGTISDLCQNIEKGEINKDGIVNSVYLGLISAYLAVIADELHDMNETNKEALANSKQAQEEMMTFNRNMQNDLRRSRDESKN